MPTNTKALQVAEPAPFIAGKNKIINGGFDIWQRGTSFTNPSTYTVDRFSQWGDGSRTVSQVDAVSSGLNIPGIKYAFRYATTSASGQTGMDFGFSLEDVQTLAGQTVTLSFYAKAGKSVTTPFRYGGYNQIFGTGGSATVGPIDIGISSAVPNLTTSWQRYSITFALPSLSGKTMGTGTTWLNFYFGLAINQNTNYDFAGFQLESGSVATPFTTATGTVQGELAACQRYYYRINYDSTSNYPIIGQGGGNSATQSRTIMQFPVTMRVKPTVIDYPALSKFVVIAYDDTINVSPTAVSVDANQTSHQAGYLLWTTSGSGVASRPLLVRGNNDSTTYFGWSAE